MAQFTVYRNRNPGTKGEYPLLLDIQSDLLDELATRVVIPLTRAAGLARQPIGSLMPIVVVASEEYVAVTQDLAGTQKSSLGPRVASVVEQRDAIVAALDFLISGV
jgi:toxin CcdB